MNSEAYVVSMVNDWKNQGKSKTEIIIGAAELEIGWCYVWGAVGQQCTPSKRQAYANRSVCPDGEKKEIINKCQVLNGRESACEGCKWYPHTERTLMDDCQGFVKQTAGRVGIKFSGGGCTSMWNTASNWSAKGTIDTLPEQLCCVFWTDTKDPKVKSHIGWYIGNGMMIHCSGEVKKEKLSKKCTDWAVPKDLGGDIPVPTHKTVKRGSTGEDVVYVQTRLIELGYDLSPYGADGKFGAKTEEAVKNFQRVNGLEADGIVGQKTYAALEDATSELYTVTIQHLGKAVADSLVQKYGGTMTKEVKDNA